MGTETPVLAKGKLEIVSKYFRKMKGSKRTAPLYAPPGLDILLSWLGAFLGIGTVAVLSLVYKMPLIVPSLGASAVLVYGIPDAPLAQPRNVILGHTISASIGVICYTFFGLVWWSAALATAMAIGAMLVTKTTHPPAGATALIAVLTKASPIYILTPVGAGAAILVLVGLLTNNLSPNRSYPKYWF